MRTSALWTLALGLLSIPLACHPARPAAATTRVAGPAAPHAAPPPVLVVWISVDGFRGDYMSRLAGRAPFLHSMVHTGAYTRELIPPFPSLTFVSHTSEVTGAAPDVHGIPGNDFWDRTRAAEYHFPDSGELLRAEPIWRAATRQGRRVAVLAWPFSSAQTGNNAAAYFTDGYDTRSNDAARLRRLIDVLRYDPARPPLSLVMGYVEGVDHAGHQVGPGAAAVGEQIEHIDALLAEVHAAAEEAVHRWHGPAGQLYFLISTDHGMTSVTHTVNLKAILGDSLSAAGTHLVTGGGTAHVFLPPDLSAEARAQSVAAVKSRLTAYPLIRISEHGHLPPRWHFDDPDRVGDLFLDLPLGYTFSSRGAPITDTSVETTTRPGDRPVKGMHSYDPAEAPDMRGFTAATHSPRDFGGRDLGPIDNRALAPTVAAWLGIAPPAQSQVPPIPAISHP